MWVIAFIAEIVGIILFVRYGRSRQDSFLQQIADEEDLTQQAHDSW